MQIPAGAAKLKVVRLNHLEQGKSEVLPLGQATKSGVRNMSFRGKGAAFRTFRRTKRKTEQFV